MRALVALLLAALAAVLVVGVFAFTGTFHKEHRTIVVQSKESVSTGDSHEYRIYTDQGVFVVEDAFFHGIFDSADRYAALEEGEAYDCTTYGYRRPFLSQFPNLASCSEVGR